MNSLLKKSLLILCLGGIGFSIVNANTIEQNDTDYEFSNYQFIEDAKLASSRYTRQEDFSIVDPSLYIEITEDDELITENSNFALYYKEDNVSFKVLNKNTNYVWATAIDDPDAGTYTGLLSSGIGIEYIKVQKDMFVEQNVGISDTVFIAETVLIENGIKISLNFGGYCSTRTCERLYPKYLEGDYTKEEMIDFGLTEINVGFDFIVTLNSEGINAYVPYDSIYEDNPDEIVLSTIIIFPSLGATLMDEIPGYMVIPDGAGALIRYEDNESKFIAPFEERFYGINIGLNSLRESVLNYPLSMPIFGAVHGINQNAFIGIIEEGEFNARLLSYPNGSHNLPYNLIFTKIDFKQTYRQSFSSDGTGGAMRYLDMNTSNISINYNFLSGNESTYVGIANEYKEYLINNDILSSLEKSDNIDIFIQYLMADSENSFFGSKVVKMSTVEEVLEMYKYFMDQGLVNQNVSLMGWNDGGYSGELPSDLDFENKLGSNNDFEDLIKYINIDNKVMLVNDYLFGSSDTNSLSYRQDVAKGSNRFKLELYCDSCVHKDFYVLYPSVSKKLALKDYSDYIKEDTEVLFFNIASFLFSYYDSGQYIREDALNYYIEIMEQYNGIGNYVYPYSYAYEYTTEFHGTPLYNSQLKYYDDLVPLLQIVLRGNIEMYSPYLNYNSLGREQILTLIDFGMNPSYVISSAPSSYLKDTDISNFFTTEFSLWKNSVVEEYNYINGALKYVDGEAIINREVLDLGIVRVTYANNVEIYINYTSSAYTYNSITINPMDYYVGGIN